jgi:Phage integrase SAM-like domain
MQDQGAPVATARVVRRLPIDHWFYIGDGHLRHHRLCLGVYILDLTFCEQAQRFLEQSQNRRRKPVATSTVATWRSCIDMHLNPRIGDLTLATINNAVAKNLIANLVGKGLSDKSVVNHFGLVKMVIASAVNEEGEELFPRKWNHEFIELPIVDGNKQRKPVFSSQSIDAMLTKTSMLNFKCLSFFWQLRAASG